MAVKQYLPTEQDFADVFAAKQNGHTDALKWYPYAVEEPYSVDELTLGGGDGLVEFGQVLGRDGEVGVEDHEDVAVRGFVALSDGVALALAVLP